MKEKIEQALAVVWEQPTHQLTCGSLTLSVSLTEKIRCRDHLMAISVPLAQVITFLLELFFRLLGAMPMITLMISSQASTHLERSTGLLTGPG